MAGRGSQRGGSKRGPSEDGHGAAAAVPSSGARFRASERTPRRSWWNSELDASVKEEDKFVVCSYNVLRSVYTTSWLWDPIMHFARWMLY